MLQRCIPFFTKSQSLWFCIFALGHRRLEHIIFRIKKLSPLLCYESSPVYLKIWLNIFWATDILKSWCSLSQSNCSFPRVRTILSGNVQAKPSELNSIRIRYISGILSLLFSEGSQFVFLNCVLFLYEPMLWYWIDGRLINLFH